MIRYCSLTQLANKLPDHKASFINELCSTSHSKSHAQQISILHYVFFCRKLAPAVHLHLRLSLLWQYLELFRGNPHLVLSFAVTRIFFCGDLCASHSFRGDPHLSADTAPKQGSCLQTQHPAPPSVCRHSTLQHPAPAGVCRHSTQPELVSAAPFHSASVRCVHPGR